jgi:hypothetical protein
MCLLGCVQIGIVSMVLELVSIALGRRLLTAGSPVATIFSLVLVVSVTALNYYAVRYRSSWKYFEPEFEGYSKLVHRVSGVVVIMLPIVLIVGIGWAATVVRRLAPSSL